MQTSAYTYGHSIPPLNEDEHSESPEIITTPVTQDHKDVLRRASVAHPTSIKYHESNLSSDIEEGDEEYTSDALDKYEYEDEETDSDREYLYQEYREKSMAPPPPENIAQINAHMNQSPNLYQPIRQIDEDMDDDMDNDDDDDEKDPFARLGQKQQSVAHPHIQKYQQIQYHKMQTAPISNNPWSPASVLEPKHLQQRHSRGASKHNRSQTTAFNNNAHNASNNRRHQSVGICTFCNAILRRILSAI